MYGTAPSAVSQGHITQQYKQHTYHNFVSKARPSMISMLMNSNIKSHLPDQRHHRTNTTFKSRSQAINIRTFRSNRITMLPINNPVSTCTLTTHRRRHHTSVQNIIRRMSRSADNVNPVNTITRMKTSQGTRLKAPRMYPRHTLTKQVHNATSHITNIISMTMSKANQTVTKRHVIRTTNTTKVIIVKHQDQHEYEHKDKVMIHIIIQAQLLLIIVKISDNIIKVIMLIIP